ncbi:MAG: ABC transporter permease [Lewinellaceae bacterium]|nr:ABC transporter permease [Lewinellaceae bacterium]
MKYTENILLALQSLKTNILRSSLTLLIIAVGITCLVGILAAIDSVLFSMSDNFSRLGANSFSIRPANENMGRNNSGRVEKESDPISFDQAMSFKDHYKFADATTALYLFGNSSATIKYHDKKTNPTTRVLGIDENYLRVSAYEIDFGRNFNNTETQYNTYKAIIGSDIVKHLFNDVPQNAVGKEIYIDAQKYFVVGVLKSKGASSGGSNDLRVFIPLYNAKVLYGSPSSSYNIIVGTSQANLMDEAVNHAMPIMRNARQLKISDKDDFEINKSDGILAKLKEMTTTLRLSTIVIALLTLLGASIGLMNIMLVTVTERTREIGIRKALGASRKNVLTQFLMEAVMICLIGGIVGIFMGVGIGFAVTVAVKGKFFIPWNWITLGIIVCIIVGVLSGLYPALKASKLDPIDALRYE